jgi:nucleotide-binding universal stress UspA family protein
MSYDVIVVASDLSEASDKVVSTAGDIARAFGAKLVSIHVVTQSRVDELGKTLPPESAYVDVIQDRIELDLDEQLSRVTSGIETSSIVIIGDEAATLHSYASDQKAGALVIGIRNRSRIGKLLMGSVAQEVLLESACPVVAVPTT